MSATAAVEAPPDLRRAWRSVRAPVLLGTLLVALLVLSAVLSAASEARPLDPRDASPSGARAVAQLLRARGVPVDPVADVSAALSGAGARTLVVVALPGVVPRTDLGRLAASAAPLLLVAPGAEDLMALGLDVDRVGVTSVGRRQPACDLAVAVTAGDVDLGGAVYAASGGDATACYPAGGDASLLQVGPADRRITILGAADPLLNGRLAHRGNAALSLGLLGSAQRVRWLIPRPPTTATPASERRGLVSLLPHRLRWALLELLLAVGLLALWRARRLGPVVDEPLPVVVRAAEAVEGRARLYRAAGARQVAGEQLRAATRARLATALGLPMDPAPQSLAAAVSARVVRPAAEVAGLLYGAGPGDDAALVDLARSLDALEAEVRTS